MARWLGDDFESKLPTDIASDVGDSRIAPRLLGSLPERARRRSAHDLYFVQVGVYLNGWLHVSDVTEKLA